MAKTITVLLFPDDEKLYVEFKSFIEFLREDDLKRPEDHYYNNALVAVADYLENKQNEILADHILNEEIKSAKEKGRLN